MKKGTKNKPYPFSSGILIWKVSLSKKKKKNRSTIIIYIKFDNFFTVLVYESFIFI